MNPATFRDHVTVRLVQEIASDSGVYHAARVSTLGESSEDQRWGRLLEWVPDPGQPDAPTSERLSGLIGYLIRSGHGSPFEHNSFTFYVEAPIFVFREFMRHRIGFSYNEASGRYKELEPIFYLPGQNRKLSQVGKPGHYTLVEGASEQHVLVEAETRQVCARAYASYQRMLGAGIAREVARMVLPLNIFSSMYVTCNARSLMNFLSLRTHRENARVPSFPQREIEMVADKMEKEATRLMPISFSAFDLNGRISL